MELPFSVGISTSVFNSKDSVSPQLSDRNIPLSGTTLGASLLASQPKVTITGSTVQNIQSGADGDRHGDRPTTPQGAGNNTGGLEVWGWSGDLNGWDDNQVQLLMSSWRASTRKTYKVAWNRWLHWSQNHKLDPYHPDGSMLARFLADMYLIENLSYNTILLHKSVVATLCNANNSTELSSHTLVKHILKSIALKKPASHKPPVWNIDTVVDYIQKNSVDKNNVFATSRHTAILLLLCSGRRIHDLTLLSTGSHNFVETNNSLTLWPLFGSKTDSSDYRQSG
ncbi:unnamed protein product [Diatraea saccharalis]|uniref:Tyr recombinase domain-containing protein n=1 Tax=Diatraea saccharalis TaxID=40085 RepID=A0A9N9R616_9NEOP|nr:unnamed protein product [Diatraea saccharalis]